MIFELKNVFKSFTNASEDRRNVLNSLNLSIEEHETIAITGPSGSGKSTLLNLIGSLDFPDSGDILYNGTNIANFSEHEKAKYRNQIIGFVFQSHFLLPQLTLLENIMLPTLALKDKNLKKEKEIFATELIEIVELQTQKYQYPSELSGGECQRTAVVRALINRPRILLADEPTGSLDEKNATKIVDLLLKINELYKINIVMVTHSEKQAQRLEKIYKLESGKLILA